MRDLTKGNINTEILSFALPVFIAYLFNHAYNLVDIRIIGSFLGNDALAAVGSISTFSDLLTGFIVGIANGFAILTARYFGEKSEENVRRSFGTSLSLGAIVSAGCILFSIITLIYCCINQAAPFAIRSSGSLKCPPGFISRTL